MEEPKKRGSLVRDRDGHIWKRGNTRWTCLAVVGSSYFDYRRRPQVVERVARLPWSGLTGLYGPVTEVEVGK